jgi:RimJ/RimL family protein N-acetyltransferase
MRYDDDWTDHFTLRDGREVELRLVRPEDKGLLQRGFAEMSPASRFLRFLGDKQRLTARDLAYLTELDGQRHLAIGAACGERGLGVARFVALPDEEGVAEPALAIVDDCQGQGLGTRMLQLLVAAAAERGYQTFRATVLAENAPMQHVLDHLGHSTVTGERDGVLTIEFDVEDHQPHGPLQGALRLAARGVLKLERLLGFEDRDR